jgi:hypothetical protein
MRRILILGSLLLITLGSTGCIRYAYRVDMESEQDLARVRAENEINARELVVSFCPPAEWEYPDERWVIIDVDLTKIDRGEHGWTGMGFGMKTSEVGYATIVFRDRVKYLMWHCANSIRDLLAQGTLGEGMRNQDGAL